jgi:hypothetical protein
MHRRIRVIPLFAMILLTSGAPLATACGGGDGPTGSSGCCTVCKEGKACGDSCISKSSTCTKGSGCACNG